MNRFLPWTLLAALFLELPAALAAAGVTLEVALAGTGAVISWPTNDTRLALQKSEDLVSWSDVDEPIRLSGEHNTVTVPIAGRAQFFRAVAAAVIGLKPAFSFRYGGQLSRELLASWQVSESPVQLDAQRIQRTRTYFDPATGLQLSVQSVEYADFHALEWRLFFENKGGFDTPILDSVMAADFQLRRGAAGEFTLHYAEGSHERITDFQPLSLELVPGTAKKFAPVGGRSSDGVMPYFNITQPGGGGTMLAIGWTGQWAVSFARDSGTNLTVKAGMELTRLRLHPGERICTPALVALQYPGDTIIGHNLWRRFMLRYGAPRPNGQPIQPPIAASGATLGFNNVSEANQIQAIANVAARKLPVDYWWIDAGWSQGGFPLGMGTWDPDPIRFPHGLQPVAQKAHEVGLRFLLWFEPERVMPNTTLRRQHPEWLLAPANLPSDLAYQQDWRLLNFGDPQALAWAKAKFSGMIRAVGIDVYRHDCNLHPLYYWRNGEAFDRTGMNEIRYVTGLYDYLDTLQREHPGLLIDNSASGGRRLDLEMLRRSVPLLRTDYLWNLTGAQSMTYGLSFWLPLHGQGAVSTSPYDFRSGMGSFAVYAFNFYGAGDAFWEPLRQQINLYRPLQKFFQGDFFPLLPFSTSNNVWIAWQFDRPDLSEGLVQAFRRADNLIETSRLRLAGLNANARYEVSNLESGAVSILSGSELMTQGLSISLRTRPAAATVVYRQNSVKAQFGAAGSR